MLRQLRHKKTSKKIWIILAILIIPPFIFWGTGRIGKGEKGMPGSVGKIFGKNISAQDYTDALLATKNQAIIQFGDKFPQMQQYLNLKTQAWERLILLSEVEKRKIKVRDQEVITLIGSYPFFQKGGRFDQDTYLQLLQYYFRTQPRVFEEQTSQNLALSKLYTLVTEALNLNEKEIKDEYIKLNQEISVYYLAGLVADFQKEVSASDAQIEDYYQKNMLEFKQPLSFNVEYIAQSAEADNKNAAEERLKNILQRVKSEKSLAKVAKDFNLEVKETGLFPQTGPIPGIGWSEEMLALISKLKPQESSNIINLDKTYYILRLKEKKEPRVPDFGEIKEKVREMFIRDKARAMARVKIEAARALAQTTDFNRAAKELNLKPDSTALFKFGSYIEGIGASDSFWTTAKNLKTDEISGIIDMPPGFYIIKLKNTVPIDEKKFSEEKKDFTNRLLTQKKQEAFLKFAEELKKKAELY